MREALLTVGASTREVLRATHSPERKQAVDEAIRSGDARMLKLTLQNFDHTPKGE